jgi:hypothetical protein
MQQLKQEARMREGNSWQCEGVKRKKGEAKKEKSPLLLVRHLG